MDSFLVASAFAVAVFTWSRGKKPVALLRFCGENSAQILFAQSISLEMFRNNILWIHNKYAYIALSIMAEIIVVAFTHPIYQRLKISKGKKHRNS